MINDDFSMIDDDFSILRKIYCSYLILDWISNLSRSIPDNTEKIIKGYNLFVSKLAIKRFQFKLMNSGYMIIKPRCNLSVIKIK